MFRRNRRVKQSLDQNPFYTTAKIFRRILLSRWRRRPASSCVLRRRRRRPNTFSFRTLTLVKVNRNQ